MRHFSYMLSAAALLAFGAAAAQTEQGDGKPALPANAPVVSGSIEPDSVGIGDRFLYSIEVETDLVQSVSDSYELIEDLPIDTLSREGRKLKLRKSYRLAAFDEGIHRVVPQVMYADKNIVDTIGGADTLELLVTTIEIDSTSHAIFDIKPQKTLPFRLGEITGYMKWTLVALLALAALAYAAKRILKRYGKRFSDMFRPAPPLPPHEAALAALEKLRAQRLWQEGKHKLYYSALTDILRTYIAGRYGVSAMEMTSDEIVEAMRGVDLPRKSAMDLAQILREADLVKFAKAAPEADENEAAYRAACDFVEQTKPEEPAADEDADDASTDAKRMDDTKS